jgi:hypothetical protein
MLSAQEIILQYVCPALGMIAANFMFAGESNVNSVLVFICPADHNISETRYFANSAIQGCTSGCQQRHFG